MAKTVDQAQAKGQAYYEAWRAGYDVGYGEGGSSATADLNLLLEVLDLPFDQDQMTEFEAVRKMAEMLKEKVTDKPFALFFGHKYYPSGGWSDFQEFFASPEEAKHSFEDDQDHDILDWMHVVDMRAGTIVYSEYRSRS